MRPMQRCDWQSATSSPGSTRRAGSHAALDQAEGADHGWAAKTDALQTCLVPDGLAPDPLAANFPLVVIPWGGQYH
jgi:hypothetical protein